MTNAHTGRLAPDDLDDASQSGAIYIEDVLASEAAPRRVASSADLLVVYLAALPVVGTLATLRRLAKRSTTLRSRIVPHLRSRSGGRS